MGSTKQVFPRKKRKKLKTALFEKQSAWTLQNGLKFKAKVCRVQHILRDTALVSNFKIKQSPFTNENRRIYCVSWERKKLRWNCTDWSSLTFTDEKHFNLDGPDRLRYVWNDLRKDVWVSSKRAGGERSVMVWGAISYKETVDLLGIGTIMDSDYYVQVLQKSLLPNADAMMGENWSLQQGNAAVHTSHVKKSFLGASSLDVPDWPGKSPDINIIENVFGVLARKMYAGRRQFSIVSDLQDSVLGAWYSIDTDYMKRLYLFILSRLVSVMGNGANLTFYLTVI